MTRREFLEMVIEGKVTDEMKDFAHSEITKMNDRNAKRKASPSKTAIANEPIKAEIVKVLTNEPKTASEIAKEVEISTQKEVKISTQKASALLRQIDGLTVTEVKIKGKGKVKGYSIG